MLTLSFSHCNPDSSVQMLCFCLLHLLFMADKSYFPPSPSSMLLPFHDYVSHQGNVAHFYGIRKIILTHLNTCLSLIDSSAFLPVTGGAGLGSSAIQWQRWKLELLPPWTSKHIGEGGGVASLSDSTSLTHSLLSGRMQAGIKMTSCNWDVVIRSGLSASGIHFIDCDYWAVHVAHNMAVRGSISQRHVRTAWQCLHGHFVLQMYFIHLKCICKMKTFCSCGKRLFAKLATTLPS